MITLGVEATDEKAPKKSDGGDSDSHDQSASHITSLMGWWLGVMPTP